MEGTELEEKDGQTTFWVEGRVSDGEPSRGSGWCLTEAKKHQGPGGKLSKR